MGWDRNGSEEHGASLIDTFCHVAARYAVLRISTHYVSSVCDGLLSDGLLWAYDLPLIGSE